MAEKFKTIKSKEHPDDWIWEKAHVTRFSCHPEVVEHFITSYRKLYGERGEELIDSHIRKIGTFANVELLFRPVK